MGKSTIFSIFNSYVKLPEGIRDAASGECGKGVIQNLQICFWCPFVLIYLLIFWTNLDLGVILQWAKML